MQIRFLIAVCFVLFWNEVYAETENDVKRGTYPFMAFVYYPDETVVDTTGARFIRAATLIRPEWLISSAIDHSDLEGVPLGFPRKTLLARLGAIIIDANLTLNEDEDEQEREVIQIVRPKQHSVEVWWTTDITVLKVLLPFKMSSAVSTTSINSKDYTEKNCLILVYTKRYGNTTDYKMLVQLPVELLPPSMDNCGGQFNDATMTCGIDSDDAKIAQYDSEFCVGNSGGPLMCEGDVIGIQTYIENNCKQPHLYTLLSTWNQFISCGVHEQCGNNDINCDICSVTFKDNVSTEHTHSASVSESMAPYTGHSPTASSIMMEPLETTEHSTIITSPPAETSTEEIETTTVPSVSETESSTTTSTTTESTITTTPETEDVPVLHYKAHTHSETTTSTSPPTTTTTTTTKTTTAKITTAKTTTTTMTTTERSSTPASTTKSKKHWPSEKPTSSHRKKLEEAEEVKRQPKAEAQQQNDEAQKEELKSDVYPKTTPAHATTHRNFNIFRILFAFLILACIV